MAYRLDKYRFPNSIEYEYKWEGKYGAKGEKREAKKKATPEQIKKQNQLNREKTVRRLIKANFLPDDLWITLKYPKGTRKPVSEVKKDFGNFLSTMRRRYKTRGQPLKYIYRMEVGKRGGIHIHMILNRLTGEYDTDLIVRRAWKHGGMNFEPTYEAGGYEKLANYIVKQPDEEVQKQLCLFEEEERKDFIKYSASRNLIHPVPERKVYRRWTLRRLIEEGPKPTQGYYIDKNSIHAGKNRYTGMSYLQYTEVKIVPEGRKAEVAPVQPKGGG